MLKKKVFFEKVQKKVFEEILDATLISVKLCSFYFERTKLVKSLFCTSQQAQNIFGIHCKPIPVMKTGFYLCSFSHGEKPMYFHYILAMRTGMGLQCIPGTPLRLLINR